MCTTVGEVKHLSKSAQLARVLCKHKSAYYNAELRHEGPKQHSPSPISPPRHERLKQGLWLVHKIIKSLMWLKDKGRRDRVEHFALGIVASSISQWKLSLGQESVFIPTITTIIPPQIRDHSTHVFKSKNPHPEPQENLTWWLRAWISCSGQIFLSVVQFTGALNRPAEQSRTLGCWPAPSTLSSNDSQTLVNLIRDYQDTAVINWKLSSESHIKSQPWGK